MTSPSFGLTPVTPALIRHRPAIHPKPGQRGRRTTETKGKLSWQVGGDDCKEYVEFLPNDVCVRGTLQGGRWVTTRDTSDVAHEGSDAECGGAGLYSRSGPNTIVLDFGMGGRRQLFVERLPLRQRNDCGKISAIAGYPTHSRFVRMSVRCPTMPTGALILLNGAIAAARRRS